LTRLVHAAASGAPIAEYRYIYAGDGSLLRVEESAGGVESALEYRRDAQGACAKRGPRLTSPSLAARTS